jgi:ribosomal protein L44E
LKFNNNLTPKPSTRREKGTKKMLIPLTPSLCKEKGQGDEVLICKRLSKKSKNLEILNTYRKLNN